MVTKIVTVFIDNFGFLRSCTLCISENKPWPLILRQDLRLGIFSKESDYAYEEGIN
jgi:hypothetical protein